jgi:hypothetical protein
MKRVLALVAILSCAACSTSSGAGGSTETGDAAVEQACAFLQSPSGNASHTPSCPVADGGTCAASSGCDPASLPTGQPCSGQYCTATIDPCVPLAQNSRIDFYACTCVSGRWACGLCALGLATCIEAGAD